MKYLLYVFYFEIVLNIVSEIQALFMPANFIAQFSGEGASPVALEMVRWYAILLLVLTYLLYRGLRSRGAILLLVLEALLIGDIIQIGLAFWTANVLGWSVGVESTIVIAAIVGTARAICLWRPDRVGAYA